jgi:hypothetical protein
MSLEANKDLVRTYIETIPTSGRWSALTSLLTEIAVQIGAATGQPTTWLAL